ncbi:hypothetical protein [Clostridium estertheticum]|uniref:hypothetical protein n=1 Tax=Clostridium estertheticum TaxID=238834 RepID=UPI001C0E2542|nr:hypothetical protein [Clostridium estertheticum]MBU3186542.1 hypothetical protein [Clostridium estertheticum]
MNKNKEIMIELFLLCGIWSVVIGVGYFHKDSKDFNGDKLKWETKEVKIIKIDDNYEKFMKIVDSSKKKIEADKIIKENNAKKLIEVKKAKEIKAKELKASSISISRGGIEYDTTFELSFYSGLQCENSSAGAIGSRGVRLFDGCVASNVIPYGTEIRLKGWGSVEVLDSGGGNFDVSNRLDVYVSREQGESDSEYYKRVQSMGRIKVQGKIIK